MTKIILINGPAGSGKDTVANSLHHFVTKRCETVKFAAPLKTLATALYCQGDSRKFYEFDHDQKRKNEPSPVFFGKTCREVQIGISEVFLKKFHSETIFGDILASTIEAKSQEGVEAFFVSDSGFKPEAQVLIEQFGPQNILLLRLHREGHTYEGDSRDYVYLDEEEVESHDITNKTGDVNVTIHKAAEIVNKFLNRENA